jgi:hypothetical protein
VTTAKLEPAVDKTKARDERRRLQILLDGYETGRQAQLEASERDELRRDLTPDRADKVRARIVRLDQFIAKA